MPRNTAPPCLKPPQSVFVVLASGAGVIGPSSSLAYGASKGGANGLRHDSVQVECCNFELGDGYGRAVRAPLLAPYASDELAR